MLPPSAAAPSTACLAARDDRLTHGLPVRLQNSARASASDSPAICATSIVLRVLNLFWKRLARRIWVPSTKYARRRISQNPPSRSTRFLKRLSASPIGSPSATTIRTPIVVRLVRLTRCRLKEQKKGTGTFSIAIFYSRRVA